jgi:hypothetical protein
LGDAQKLFELPFDCSHRCTVLTRATWKFFDALMNGLFTRGMFAGNMLKYYDRVIAMAISKGFSLLSSTFSLVMAAVVSLAFHECG